MAEFCQNEQSAQTNASGHILAKNSTRGVFYFFTGSFTKVSTDIGSALVGETGLFPTDAFPYESELTAQRIANQLNKAGIGSLWRVVPAATPYQLPTAPTAHPGVLGSAPPA